jgi:hypothetical protein
VRRIATPVLFSIIWNPHSGQTCDLPLKQSAMDFLLRIFRFSYLTSLRKVQLLRNSNHLPLKDKLRKLRKTLSLKIIPKKNKRHMLS